MSKLIGDYRFELVPDHHNPGSGRYGLCITFNEDIGEALPYLNSVLTGTEYDHANRILIGKDDDQRYAFRPHEIRLALLKHPSDAERAAREAVEMVNKVWEGRTRIAPSTKRTKVPAVYDIFKLLPRSNCKKCGRATCLVFAADLRVGKVTIDECAPLCQPEKAQDKERISGLF